MCAPSKRTEFIIFVDNLRLIVNLRSVRRHLFPGAAF